MKNINIYNYSSSSSLLSAILFLVFGVVLFTNPGGIVKFISYIMGSILIIIGIYNFIVYTQSKNKLNINLPSKLIAGIVLIIIGIISIICASVIETIIRLIIGAWIIYIGVMRLIDSINYKKDKISFIVRLVIAIILILFGLYIVLKTNLVFSVVGLCIMIYAVLDIIGFIFYSRKA